MPATTITLLNEHYNINADDNDIATLQESAQLLDTYLRSVKDSNNSMSAEKIAIMAGLNLARTFVTYKHNNTASTSTQETLERLTNKISREMESIIPQVIPQN